MPVGLAAQLAAVRTALAAITPDTTPTGASSSFSDVAGTLRHEHEPPALSDRAFDVRPLPEPPAFAGVLAADTVRLTAGFEVAVWYAALGDFHALDARMAEDAERIVVTLIRPQSYAAGVEYVAATGGDEPVRDGEYIRKTMRFSCRYGRAI